MVVVWAGRKPDAKAGCQSQNGKHMHKKNDGSDSDSVLSFSDTAKRVRD